jgi:hypothetical protein
MGAKVRHLEQYYRPMFEAELDAWIIESKLRPTRDLRIFRVWFHATLHETVYDPAPDDLVAEEDL